MATASPAQISYVGLAKNGYVTADYSLSDEEFRIEFQQALASAKPETAPGISTVQKGIHTYYVRHTSGGYDIGCVIQEGNPNEFLDKLEKRVQQYFTENGGEGANKSTATDLTKIIRELIVRLLFECRTIATMLK